jgi:DNA-binding LacI/PurR family transcriptional regulator
VDDREPHPIAAKRPTMGDIAARAGVSKALVSLVFRNAPGASPETRARVLEAANQLGYRHNRAASLLARRRTRLLGVTMILRNTYHAELVEDIQAAADDLGYEMVLSTVTRTHDEQRAVETLLESRCEAIILLGPELTPASLAALGGQLPAVVVGSRVTVPGVDVVRPAEEDGIGQVIDHLAGLGHREIVHVDGGDGIIAGDRRDGYRTAIHRHGLDAQIRAGGFTEDAGVAAAQALLAEGRLPTAIVAANDRAAIGLLDALTRAGVRVPETVSLVGYDDSMLSRLAYVDLTTVNQQPMEHARRAVAAAVERLDQGRTAPHEVVIPPRLVVRGTTGPARS